MLRRYHDAIDILTGILLYIGRTKKVQAHQYDQAKYDSMYALLAILITLLPTTIDEHVYNTLQTEHSDKVIASQRDMEQLFLYSCPKFVSPVPPIFDDEVFVHSSAPIPLQRKVFMKEIDQQSALPTILSYLKLYSSIGLEKFVTLLDKKMNTQMLRNHLLCLAHKSFQKHLIPGSSNLSEGVRESSSYQQFWLEADMVHIVDKPAEMKYGDAFLDNTNSIISAIAEIKKTKV